LNREIVDYGSDAGDLGGVGGGKGAGSFAADVAVEGGDAVLNRGLNGFGAESAVASDAALQGRTKGGVVDWSCGLSALASGRAYCESDGCNGCYGLLPDMRSVDVHTTPWFDGERCGGFKTSVLRPL
jgi:hypothetical protein